MGYAKVEYLENNILPEAECIFCGKPEWQQQCDGCTDGAP